MRKTHASNRLLGLKLFETEKKTTWNSFHGILCHVNLEFPCFFYFFIQIWVEPQLFHPLTNVKVNRVHFHPYLQCSAPISEVDWCRTKPANSIESYRLVLRWALGLVKWLVAGVYLAK
jgi:hypothetical protein